MNLFRALITSMFLVTLIGANTTAFAVSSPTMLSIQPSHKMIDVNNIVPVICYLSPTIIKPSENLSIKVFDPLGQLYYSDSLNLTNNAVAAGTYNYGFDFNGKPAAPGNYEIMASYGSYDAETLVTYLSGNNDPNVYYSYLVQIADQTHPIRYKTTQGSEVESMSVTPTSNLLQVVVDSSVDNGTLMLEVPRSVTDAKQNGNDVNYVVLMSQGTIVLSKTPAHFTEINSSFDTRTLQIDLEKGIKEIWIYGTQAGSQ
ncbi:MAG: hypothetical protein KGH89_02770 [Thaumarchaeota archaeon]|nr:hypothetical protein [Nitrososphaerota archaeon]